MTMVPRPAESLTAPLCKKQYHLGVVLTKAVAVICHECLMSGRPHESATALCRFCLVALCKTHLVELYRHPPSVPTYSCRHTPASAPGGMPAGRRATNPRPASAAVSRLAPGFGNA